MNVRWLCGVQIHKTSKHTVGKYVDVCAVLWIVDGIWRYVCYGESAASTQHLMPFSHFISHFLSLHFHNNKFWNIGNLRWLLCVCVFIWMAHKCAHKVNQIAIVYYTRRQSVAIGTYTVHGTTNTHTHTEIAFALCVECFPNPKSNQLFNHTTYLWDIPHE